jgi:GntR family transcriptional regulator
MLVRSSIRAGALAVGDYLVEDQLVKSLATSRNAVREALQMLADDGIVMRRPRVGTLVAHEISELPLVDLIDEDDVGSSEIVLLDRRRVPSNDYLRFRLQTTAAELIMTEYALSVSGVTIAIGNDYVEPSMTTKFANWTRVQALGDLVSSFEHVRGVPFGSIDLVIETANADSRMAKQLGVREGAALLVRETLVRDDSGQPRILGFVHVRGDRASFHASVTRDEILARRSQHPTA